MVEVQMSHTGGHLVAYIDRNNRIGRQFLLVFVSGCLRLIHEIQIAHAKFLRAYCGQSFTLLGEGSARSLSLYRA